MRETAAQAVLLARAFEEADRAGVLLAPAERDAATEAARALDGDDAERAADRAERLLAALETRAPALGAVRRTTRLPLAALLPVPAIAFAVGVLGNVLGPERHVNVLSFPLLGLLAWNLLVYLALAAWQIAHLARRTTPAVAGAQHDSERTWRGAIGAAASRVAELALRRVRFPDAPRTTVAARALQSYWRAWSRLSAPLVGARVRFALHLGAAALVLGAVTGMYVRGLTFEYRATWESTFVGPATASLLLRIVLGPAAALLGGEPIDAARLEAMRAPGDAPAATWIHLWAATAALVVLIPRGVLATLALIRERRLARSFDVDPLGGSFRVLLAPDRGAGITVDVLPYSYAVAGREADTLRELLHDVLGLRADVRLRAPLPYGAAVEDVPASDGDAAPYAVIVYGLVQSPEREVHGRFARELRERAPHGAGMLAVVDSSSWHARFRDGDPRREHERRRAWDRVLEEVGVEPLHVDLAATLENDAIEQAEARLTGVAAEAR